MKETDRREGERERKNYRMKTERERKRQRVEGNFFFLIFQRTRQWLNINVCNDWKDEKSASFVGNSKFVQYLKVKVAILGKHKTSGSDMCKSEWQGGGRSSTYPLYYAHKNTHPLYMCVYACLRTCVWP